MLNPSDVTKLNELLDALGEVKEELANVNALKKRQRMIEKTIKTILLNNEECIYENSDWRVTIDKAIKDNDDMLMFEFLGVKTKPLEGGALEIGTYRPVYSLNSKSGISVPYSMFGLNEDDLLAHVRVINGDLVLNHKNKIFESRITKFPPELEQVTGKIHCTAEQYERFAADIDRVIGNDKSKLVIHRL